MADEEKDVEEQEGSQEGSQEDSQEDSKAEKTDEKASGGGILPWIIIAAIVVLCAAAGFGLGRLLAGSRTRDREAESQQGQPTQVEDLRADDNLAIDSQKNWYYDLEPVVANLDVPGVTRYVRASLTLEISSEVDSKKGTVFLKERNPLLTNWLTIYLASLSLEDIRGDRNLRRIQSQILDAFNEKLFPDAKPQIKHILFKEFAIQ